MVGWLYINDEVAAPLRALEADTLTGVVSIEVSSRFIANRAILRGRTLLEYRDWPERREVRCLGAEQVGQSVMIEAVDVGKADIQDDASLGIAEDWLVIDEQAYCRVAGVRAGSQPTGHCMFEVALTDWRDLRIGEGAPLACVGVTRHGIAEHDGSITPLLHVARELPTNATFPNVEIIRLRERERLTIQPIATDWGDEFTLVVARIRHRAPLSLSKANPQTVDAH